MQVQVASTPSLCVIGVCVGVGGWVGVCARMLTSTYACAGPKTTLGIIPRCHAPYCLRQGLSLGMAPTDALDWLANNLQRSSLGIYPPQHWDSQHASSIRPGFPNDHWGSNSLLIRQTPQHLSHLPSPPSAF